MKEKYYDQVDGVAMGSPLGPLLANILCVILKRSGSGLARIFLQYGLVRYVDSTLALFDERNPRLTFCSTRTVANNMKFTMEFEENSKIPFLDVLLKRYPDNAFMTSIYQKKTFTGLYTKWDSFTSRNYKVNLISTLTYRCFRIYSSPSLH